MKKYALLFINVVTRFFTGLTVTIALILTIAGSCYSHDHITIVFSEIHIIKIFVFALVLGIITILRKSLETTHWMMRLSFIQRRWIFFPLYLTATLLFIYKYGVFETFGLKEVALYSSIFIICASIITAVMNRKYRTEKQHLTKSVTQYKNKLGKK